LTVCLLLQLVGLLLCSWRGLGPGKGHAWAATGVLSSVDALVMAPFLAWQDFPVGFLCTSVSCCSVRLGASRKTNVKALFSGDVCLKMEYHLAKIENGTSLTGREAMKISSLPYEAFYGRAGGPSGSSEPAVALPDRSDAGAAELPDRATGGSVCGERKDESLSPCEQKGL